MKFQFLTIRLPRLPESQKTIERKMEDSRLLQLDILLENNADVRFELAVMGEDWLIEHYTRERIRAAYPVVPQPDLDEFDANQP